VSITT